MDIKRPSSKDTDEDLLKLQNDFLSSKAKPAVTIVNVKPSTAATNKNSDKSGNSSTSTNTESGPESIDETPSVLTEILERVPELKLLSNVQEDNQQSFPRPFKRTIEQTTSSKNPKVKKSIFAEEMKKRKTKTSITPTFESCLLEETNNKKEVNTHSYMVDGSGLNSTEESKKIHDENLGKLKAMTKAEIEEHQKQIMSHLDPKIIDFLRSKNKSQKEAKDEKPQKTVTFSSEASSMETEEASKIAPDEMPINPEQIKANKWLGMNKVEWKKMEWMKSLPEPNLFDPNTGSAARFDLEGNLVTGKTDIPIHIGLHHHGDEPEKPGYTFEELFRLCRSDLAAQRCLALNTTSHILSLNSRGQYDELLTIPLLPQLIDSGLILLLRCAIDDEQASVWTAGIAALHSLLVSQVDEEALDHVFSWVEGHISPFLCPTESPIIVDVDDEDEQIEKMKDYEIVQKDVILGLLRMDLLPRLRYILEVLKPDSTVTNNVLGILIRVSRHSPQLSDYLFNCPRLVRVIVDSFLPLHWPNQSDHLQGSTLKFPFRLALKLIRVLSGSSLNIAEKLISIYNVDIPLRCYLSCEPNDDRMTSEEMLKLSVEALRNWQTFLHYGLLSEILLDIFPVWMRRLSFCQNLGANDILHRGDLIYASVLISTLDALAQNISKQIVVEEIHLTSVLSLILGITKKWTIELTEDCRTDMSEGWSALAAGIRLLHTFFERFASSMYQQESDQLKMIVEKCVLHPTFTNLATKLKFYSSLLEESNNSIRYAENLPQTGAALWGGKGITKILNVGTNMPLQVSISGALKLLSKNPQTLNENTFKIYFKALNSYFRAVFGKISTINEVGRNRYWFAKFEITLLVNSTLILGNGNKSASSVVDYEFFHELSLLLPQFIVNILRDEALQQLLDFVIFNPVYYTNILMDETRLKIEALSVTDSKITTKNKNSNLENNLTRVKADYSIAFNHGFGKPTNETTQVQLGFIPSKLSKTNPWRRSHILQEWVFLPLTMENNQNNPSVERCLDWICFLIKHRKALITKMIKPGKLFCNIATSFLLDGEPFLVPEIKIILSDILSFYLNNWPTPLLSEEEIGFPILELFEELINQFEATSYGDKLFANVIVVFLQAQYPHQFKTLFFKEHRMALSFVRLGLLECMLPIEFYLTPLETNAEVLEVYFQLLISGGFSKSSLFYAMAVHHLHHYLFSTDTESSTFKTKTINTLVTNNQKNKEMSNILKYKEICLITRTLKFHDGVPTYVKNNLKLE